jgi:ABC-type antimicrobial peptide transport system permease subunit
MTLQVRSSGGAAAMVARIREHARAIDPAMVVLQSGAMGDTLRSAASLYETLARMLTLIGALAVAVSALGVYGLLAYTVRQRSREIGVRTALGAPRGAIVGVFLRRGATLIVMGISLGLLIAFAVSRLMTRVLLDVVATDMTSFVMATAVVATAAVMASVIPAWRAATLDPLSVLRHE